MKYSEARIIVLRWILEEKVNWKIILNKNAITFTSDSNYMNYTINLLKSIEKNCKGIEVYYRGVNITLEEEYELNKFDINCCRDKRNLSTKRDLIKLLRAKEKQRIIQFLIILSC